MACRNSIQNECTDRREFSHRGTKSFHDVGFGEAKMNPPGPEWREYLRIFFNVSSNEFVFFFASVRHIPFLICPERQFSYFFSHFSSLLDWGLPAAPGARGMIPSRRLMTARENGRSTGARSWKGRRSRLRLFESRMTMTRARMGRFVEIRVL